MKPEKTDATIGVNYVIPRETHNQIKELAKADDRTLRSMITRLTVDAVNREYRRKFGDNGAAK